MENVLKAMSWLVSHPPAAVGLVYLVMSLVTYVMYVHDKHAAQKGAWRTPEATLHLLELGCGWPGALLAQKWVHHKCSKVSYQIVFWIMVVLNVAVFAFLTYGWLSGDWLLRK